MQYEPAATPLLAVRDLAVSFGGPGKGEPRTRAVDGVSMTIHPCQTLAVVGESGSGKSVTAMSLLQLLARPPARIERGRATFQSARGPVDLLSLPERDMRRIRGGEIAMIFQEPMTSLNPVFTIGDQIVEAILLHQHTTRRGAREIAIEAMRGVGIPEPERRIDAYPHQFSGGMRQRVMIAMALACRPNLLLADEPTTALDVTIQQQILALLRDFKRDRGMAIMLITHDLGLVADHADVVCVMYAGRVVEYATVAELFAHPLHPYTRGLLACVPRLGDKRDRLATVAEVIDTPGSFDGLSKSVPGSPDDLRPWWPRHDPPRSVASREDAAAAGGDSLLYEIVPDHWIGVWRTQSLREHAPRAPDLPFHAAAHAKDVIEL